MRILRPTLAALIVLGALAVWWGTSRGALQNSEPVRLPYPGAGYQVSQRFSLASPGRFQLQIATPATAAEMRMLHREQPPVACDVQVMVRGPKFSEVRRITNFHNGGWTNDQNLFFPPGDLFIIPRAGDYEITLKSTTDVVTFTGRGAIVTLERWEDVGSALGWGLAVLVGYCCLALASIIAIVSANRPGA